MPVRTQLMTLTESVWHMCGRLVGGVGPKMKSCYLLRVKQRLAFCCPLLPNKLFSVFSDLRLLPGVLVFTCSTGETQFSTSFCGDFYLNDELICSGGKNPLFGYLRKARSTAVHFCRYIEQELSRAG